ncbi:MAG: cAMP-binding protein [Sorangium cellulosum]|nr:MAG: cAMP-binding protein [Sorangium cellulosum]
MAVSPSDLRAIPLFQDIADDHLKSLMDVFERRQHKKGEVLFTACDESSSLLLLVSGEVALYEEDEVRFRLRPIAPIGELGALTGLRRYTTAKVTEASEVWRIPAKSLLDFFEANGDVAFPFYHSLLGIVANKVRRDTRRLEEMRKNIVRTQKSMKRMRDLLLESEDTPISKPIHDTLEDLIENNRRWHYFVEPAHALRAFVRFDDGTKVPVVEMSDGWLLLGKDAPGENKMGAYWSAVLILPSGEIPISGTVDRSDANRVVIKLDLLIREYASTLEDYLTRLHMLDFVV